MPPPFLLAYYTLRSVSQSVPDFAFIVITDTIQPIFVLPCLHLTKIRDMLMEPRGVQGYGARYNINVICIGWLSKVIGLFHGATVGVCDPVFGSISQRKTKHSST